MSQKQGRSRSRSRSKSPSRGSGWGNNRNSGRSRSRSTDRFDQAPPAGVCSGSFHESMMQRSRALPKFDSLEIISFSGSKSVDHNSNSSTLRDDLSSFQGSERENFDGSFNKDGQQWGRSPAKKQKENEEVGAESHFGEEEEEEGMIRSEEGPKGENTVFPEANNSPAMYS